MNLAFLAVMYFFVVVIIVLAFLLVKEKQLMYKLLDEKEELQEHLSDLKIEKVRMNHMLKMQDESIVHLIDETEQPEEVLKEEFGIEERPKIENNRREEPPIAEEPVIVLNNGVFSRYEEEEYY